jgi:uncharacterized protein YjbI with pentapeptide repeats
MRDRHDHGRQRSLGMFLVLASLATLLLVACVFVLPPLLVPAARSAGAGISPMERLRLENERVRLRNEARGTLLQAFGGAFFLVTAILTWRQIQVAREGQITDRFSRAIEHLGTDDKLEVRLGGIYALERIANDSSREQRAIIEILAAYARRHAGRPVASNPGSAADALAELPPLQARAPDLQAVMTVLGRRPIGDGDAGALQLAQVDLRKAALPGANLRTVNLAAADLAEADLGRADLRGADLVGAELSAVQLVGAVLVEAHLQGTRLRAADLTGADLRGADLTQADLRAACLVRGRLERAVLADANLGEARLQDATLRDASLQGANLWGADLAGVDLRGAHLEGSTLVGASLHGASLHGVDLGETVLEGAVLAGARVDPRTAWPVGFDWQVAGAIMESGPAGTGLSPSPRRR